MSEAEIEKLRQERDFLASVIEALPAILFCKDADQDLRFTIWNRKAQDIFGIPAESALGKGDSDFFSSDQAGIFRQKDLETLEAGRIVDVPEESLDSLEKGTIYLRTRKIPLTDASGRKRFLLGVSEDITQSRQRANEARAIQEIARLCLDATTLNELYEKLPALLHEKVQCGLALISLVDPGQRELEIVGAYVAAPGGRNPELVGSRHPSEALFAGQSALKGEPQIGAPNSEELAPLHPAFKEISARKLVTVPLKFEGRVLGMLNLAWTDRIEPPSTLMDSLLTIGDIIAQTIRRLQIQAALVASARMASLGEMSSSIAHEINNPLTIINGRASQLKALILQGKFDPEKARASLDKIEAMVERISKIMRGLKTFARDGERDPFTRTPVSAFFQDARELCIERFHSRGVELRMTAPGNIELECRPGQMVQTLVNLLNNAFDAVEALDEKWVDVSAQVHEGELRIRVMDSGRGVPRAIAERMMVPFFTTKGPDQGTGLGLSISRGIVASHHGKLWLDPSCPNTCMVIDLPLTQGLSSKESVKALRF